MKYIPIAVLKDFFRDRTMVTLVGGLLLLTVVFMVYFVSALEPSDLQVAIRYTAFGDTHFYRGKWYYLLSFAVYSISLVGLHTALAVKLHGRSQRHLAIAVLSLAYIMFIISWIVTQSVLGIAFL